MNSAMDQPKKAQPTQTQTQTQTQPLHKHTPTEKNTTQQIMQHKQWFSHFQMNTIN